MKNHFRLPLFALLLLLASCRVGGIGGPATTVAQFFSKYDGKTGFHTVEWSAGMLQRLTLVQAAKLLGGSDLTNAITGIRSARFISFAPTSTARLITSDGLQQEASGVLQSEKYQALATSGFGGSSYAVATRGSGDKVSEFAATGSLPDITNSFVLVSVQGNFTRSEVAALSKYLPQIVQATSK